MFQGDPDVDDPHEETVEQQVGELLQNAYVSQLIYSTALNIEICAIR
jgi:hypothetical protein